MNQSLAPSEPRPFKARLAGQCADGSFIYDWCRGIQPGDIIVRRPTPALFDRPGPSPRGNVIVTRPTSALGDPGSRDDVSPYYKLWYSHIRCWKETQREAALAAAQEEKE